MSQDAGEFDPDDPSFPPEPPAQGVNYSTYLKIEELLQLQKPLSRPEHHDEHLFIMIHQVYELWFKQILHEMDALMAAFDRDAVLVGHKVMRRILAIQNVLVEQLAVLETMTPQDFGQFRKLLNPASGFQSSQFRELEAASGLKDARFRKLHKKVPAALARLDKRLDEPSLYDRFCSLLKRRGFDVEQQAPTLGTPASDALVAALKAIYMAPEDNYDLYLMCEYLIEYDERFQYWRFGHVKMVERTIGSKKGTGGSPGAAYLRTTVYRRMFPELWDVRAHLGGST